MNMDDSSTLTDQLSHAVAAQLAAIDQETADFAAISGIRCRSGCGQCCLSATVEARIVELLPMAKSLFEDGLAETVYLSIQNTQSDGCVLYQSNPSDPSLGRCSRYQYRPSVCRLFGFAGIRRKNGSRELVSCDWQKKLQPETIRTAQQTIDTGGTLPMFPDFGMRLSALTANPSLTQMLPINQALAAAIEKVSLAQR